MEGMEEMDERMNEWDATQNRYSPGDYGVYIQPASENVVTRPVELPLS
jgi:hypothetical protein